ncbi:MAG TPA: DUF4350 domain-containing protein [Flavisolibacter sp.]|jgi:hypothetical protein|nr:DUF4350 domain-containing protein [Flavisolibacter sp.]
MKKFWPYIIIFGVLALVFIVIIGANRKLPRRMDERVTLREKDKIPYGTAAARGLISSLFPNASVTSDSKNPGYWKGVYYGSNKQAVILMSGYFNADEYELKKIMDFVRDGNYVFIIGRGFSTDVQTAFNFTYNQDNSSVFYGVVDDSLKVKLETPSFSSDSLFVYPGTKFESWFETYDTAHALVLGRNETYPDFIRMNIGEGSVFIHAAPLAFSNYFILHKNNIRYFEQVLSVIPADVEKIVWNDYYLNKKVNNQRNRDTNWLGVLFKIPAFKAGFFVILLLLLLWVLLNSRRKQRMIPEYAKPRNESLDFVKTMGRLYYERRDHQNLAKKMGTYFLEHVRSTYKLPTHTLDEEFVESLHFKSGYSREDLTEIVSFVQYLQDIGGVNEQQLIHFHNQLESFYQNT